MEILKVENLSFSYPGSDKKAIENISFSLERGEFAVICGATGSGKSTLLRLLKCELSPLGEKSGRVLYLGENTDSLDAKTAAGKIGFVMQKPEEQIVTDKVWHELAFGLENLGVPGEACRRRVAEIAAYFGIDDIFECDTASLSGGQKQLLNLASVMVMQPDILLLDEPTAQLDPITASEFVSTLSKLRRELSLTILLVEHRLEDSVVACDKLITLDGGRLLCCAPPREALKSVGEYPDLLRGMPAAVRLRSEMQSLTPSAPMPLSICEGRSYIESRFAASVCELPGEKYTHASAPALEYDGVYMRYSRSGSDVLSNLNLTVYEGEIYCLLGANGSGKTTALGAAAGILPFYAGDIRVFGKRLKAYKNGSLYSGCLALLPQDVQALFLCNTVREELSDAGIDAESLPFDISALGERHPYDLSGGEAQLVALAKVLARKPRLCMLDEPTKGLDANTKAGIIEVLKKLKASGMTILIVTHDVEFAAAVADRCGMFFRGEVVASAPPREFFSENNFYTTAASRMTRGYYSGIVTLEEAARICRENGLRSETCLK